MPPECKLCHQHADLNGHGPGCRVPWIYLLLLAYERAYERAYA